MWRGAPATRPRSLTRPRPDGPGDAGLPLGRRAGRGRRRGCAFATAGRSPCPPPRPRPRPDACAHAPGDAQKREPFLASFLYSAVLSHDSLPRCLASVLANKLGSASGPLPNTLLYELLRSALPASPQAVACAHADLAAVMERDPACGSYTQCILFFKARSHSNHFRIPVPI